ncbi:RodZ domain-containing protein [Alkalimarinus alittae]|uniref:DUF4115 domain-containing protein n=1 Tax=Alkalimarinus alittae TaxID=2961619 RepID=A0ABY6N6H5_9ALTE|nr:RodZ domain-containing protein [Alkalimarinus alittae]UZE97713.1 DUF4115 domain-containing protein [Alkalimarinus alittae]
MSEQTQEQQQMAQASGLGHSLRSGREAKGYTVERVADELHLRPSIVVAMEEENYKVLPSDIFLKGYIRSYARLVNLSEAVVIQQLEAHIGRKAEIEANTKQSNGKAKRNKRSKYVVILLLLIAASGTIVYFFSDKMMSDTAISETPTSATNVNVHRDVASEDVSDNVIQEVPPLLEVDVNAIELNKTAEVTDAVDDNSNEAPTAGAIESASEGVEIESETVEIESETVEKVSPVNIPKSIAADDNALDASEPDVMVEPNNIEVLEVNNNQESSPEVVLDTGTLNVKFTGDCWFTLKNGNGKTVIADLKKAGEEVNYTGGLPFSVVIGAVSEATVLFNDKVIDFSTVRVRNNRASLELTH